jgi:hypothetical protein
MVASVIETRSHEACPVVCHLIFEKKGLIMDCEHKFELLSSNCSSYYEYGSVNYKRVDEFFCNKCLKIETKVRTESCRNSVPDWYFKN